MQLVDQTGAQVLLDGGGTPADGDILPLGGLEAPSSAASMPASTKWNVIPPFIVTGGRG